MRKQLFEGLGVPEATPADPESIAKDGTVLFCAAGPKKWAKTPLESKYTMFSGAVLNVLKNGDRADSQSITIKRFGDLVKREIKTAFGSQGVDPQVTVLVQGSSDILAFPLFPNPRFKQAGNDERITAIEAGLTDLRREIAKLTDVIRTTPPQSADMQLAGASSVTSVSGDQRNGYVRGGFNFFRRNWERADVTETEWRSWPAWVRSEVIDYFGAELNSARLAILPPVIIGVRSSFYLFANSSGQMDEQNVITVVLSILYILSTSILLLSIKAFVRDTSRMSVGSYDTNEKWFENDKVRRALNGINRTQFVGIPVFRMQAMQGTFFSVVHV